MMPVIKSLGAMDQLRMNEMTVVMPAAAKQTPREMLLAYSNL